MRKREQRGGKVTLYEVAWSRAVGLGACVRRSSQFHSMVIYSPSGEGNKSSFFFHFLLFFFSFQSIHYYYYYFLFDTTAEKHLWWREEVCGVKVER